MLVKGLNHVATITNDTERLIAFYKEVFEAEVLRDGSEFPEGEGPRLVDVLGPLRDVEVPGRGGSTRR